MPTGQLTDDVLRSWSNEPLISSVNDPSTSAISRDASERARAEIVAGHQGPTRAFAQQFSVNLGLLRLTSVDPVALADGTHLAEHQVEVLEALLAAETVRISGEQDEHRPAPTLADPNSDRRYWFEHATGSGKTVVACALVEANRGGATLILTHRSVLVAQFEQELSERGYGDRIRPVDQLHNSDIRNPVAVATYQYWTRNWDQYPADMLSLVLCDESHQTLGSQTSNAIKALEDVIVVGMTATGQLLSKSVADLFPRQISRFDLRQAARSGVISPLRVLRFPSPIPVDTIKNLRRRAGDFDPDDLSGILDRDPINHGVAKLYRDNFGTRSGVIYTTTVKHAQRVAAAFIAAGIPAGIASGQTPKAELNQMLADYEHGKLRVIVNAQLLTEGWNSPRAEVCVHLAPTASKRVYLQRVGRVTRRSPGKETGIVVDFVPDGYENDGQIVTLHSLLRVPVYQTGAPVTLPPASQPTPKLFAAPTAKSVMIPIAAEQAVRDRVIQRHPYRVTIALMTDKDRSALVRHIARTATSIPELRRALDAVSDHPGLTVTCLRDVICRTDRPASFQLAVDRLTNLAQEGVGTAWQAITDGALNTSDLRTARKLNGLALELARDGHADTVDDAHQRLLTMARNDSSVYERISRSSRLGRTHFVRGQIPTDVAALDEIAIRAMRLASEEAISTLVSLPVTDPRVDHTVLSIVQQLFAAPTNLASVLLRARTYVTTVGRRN